VNTSFSSRVALTSSCLDCDHLPRHPKAGLIEIDDAGNRFQYMFNGVKVLYGTYHSPWMNEIITNLRGHHEPQEEIAFHVLLSTLPDTARMVELGANWAYYSIWFNKVIRSPYNLCLEPIEENAKHGLRNISLNQCVNIDYVQGFIGLQTSPGVDFINWDGSVIVLNRYTLNDLIQVKGGYFDIVHSDIQGGELDMLISAGSVLDKVGYFVISTHNDKHTQCRDFLIKNGFQILVEHTIAESYSADGLLLAVNVQHIARYESRVKMGLKEYFSSNCKISKLSVG
jgi:hypothetical protein